MKKLGNFITFNEDGDDVDINRAVVFKGLAGVELTGGVVHVAQLHHLGCQGCQGQGCEDNFMTREGGHLYFVFHLLRNVFT